MIRTRCQACNLGGDCQMVGRYAICKTCLDRYNYIRTLVIEAASQLEVRDA